jgi:hypothetical protein
MYAINWEAGSKILFAFNNICWNEQSIWKYYWIRNLKFTSSLKRVGAARYKSLGHFKIKQPCEKSLSCLIKIPVTETKNDLKR